MSGVAKGVGKAFKTVTNVATRVIAPVAAIGATLFTGGMAGGLPSMLAGGANMLMGGFAGGRQGQNGVLPNILGGAFNVLTRGAFGQQQGMDFGGMMEGSSSNSGLLSGIMQGSDRSAAQVDLLAPKPQQFSGMGAGVNSIAGAVRQNSTAPEMSARSLFDQIFNDKSTERAGLLSGLGSGINDYMAARQQQKLVQMRLDSEQQLLDKKLQAEREQEQRRAASYHMSPNAYIQSPYGGPRVGF